MVFLYPFPQLWGASSWSPRPYSLYTPQHHAHSSVHSPAPLVSIKSSSDHVTSAQTYSLEPSASPVKPKLLGLWAQTSFQAYIPQMSSGASGFCSSGFFLSPDTFSACSGPGSDFLCSFCLVFFPPGPPAQGLPLAPLGGVSTVSLYCFIHDQILI